MINNCAENKAFSWFLTQFSHNVSKLSNVIHFEMDNFFIEIFKWNQALKGAKKKLSMLSTKFSVGQKWPQRVGEKDQRFGN